jgi:hypothetical protein
MKSEYRLVLLVLWVLGVVVSGILIGVHAHSVGVGQTFYEVPEVDAVINSHARVMLALGVTFGAFIAWLVVGAFTGREHEAPPVRKHHVTGETVD